MKTVKVFYGLFTCFAIGFLLTAFSPKPVKVIVDEIVFANESMSVLAIAAPSQAAPTQLTLPVAKLKNLPTNHQQKDTTGAIKWYPDNSKAGGYFVRIERIGTSSQPQVKLKFLMMLTPATLGHAKALLFLPPTNSDETTKLKQNPVVTRQGSDFLLELESKGGLICELVCNGDGFKIRNIRLSGHENARFRVTVFSKNDIDH